MARVNKVKKNTTSYEIQDNRINSLSINGSVISTPTPITIYAPTAADTAGKVVTSAGANQPLTYTTVDTIATKNSTNLVTSGGVTAKVDTMFTASGVVIDV